MEGDLQAVVGRNLRRIRKESGRSQETFGRDIQWHRTFVGAVERGERNLTLTTLEFLSDQLGVHPLDLLWDQEGIGVVVSVSRCTLARRALSASLCRTPKRCSSSMTSNPRSGNSTSCCNKRCVPIRTST